MPIKKLMHRYRKFGFVLFLFFLIKGLLWIIVPALIVFFGIDYALPAMAPAI